MGISVADKTEYTGAPEVVSTYHAGGAGIDVKASPNAFGASLFDAIHGFGKTGEEIMLKRQELANSLDHDQRAVDTSKEISNAWSDYGKLEGDAAVKGLPAFQDKLKSIYNNAVENAPNDAVRKMVANSAYRDVDRYMSHGANYADTQFRNWHNKVHSDAIDNNINQVTLNRRQPLQELDRIVEEGANGVGGANSVREKMLTKFDKDADLNAPEVKSAIEGEVSKYVSSAVVPMIEELANEGDIAGAEERFSHFKSKMDGKSVRAVEGFLRPKLIKARVSAIADELKPIPDESGYFPTNAAEQRRLTAGTPVPSREASASLGGQAPSTTPSAGASHPSDFFVKLERGNAGIDYINTKDTDGSHSYGSMGLNSRGGAGSSAERFSRANPHLGLSGAPGSAEFDASWKRAAKDRPQELRAAEQKWWKEHNLDPIPGKLKAAGIPASIADDRLVQLYLADRNDQHGEHILDARSGKPGQVTHIERMQDAAKQANGDPKKFLDLVRASDVAHLQGDFGSTPHSALNTGAYSPTSHQNRLDGRMASAKQALAAEQGAPAQATQPTAEPAGGILQPGYGAREAHRKSNLVVAHERARRPDGTVDTQMEHELFNELNRRDILMKNNLGGQRAVVQDAVKNLDLMAAKGLPGISLAKAGLTEDYIRSLYADKPHIAEHMIENVTLQSQLADKLNSMKFASKGEWEKFFVNSQQGIGLDTMIQQHRKGAATTSAFAMGSNPEANAEIMTNNMMLRDKLAATVRKAYTDRQIELGKDPAAFMVSSENPAIAKAMQKAGEAKTPVEAQGTFREYASLQVAAQRAVGVPEDKLRVLTAKKAESVASDIMMSNDPKQYLNTMKSTYGDMYPAVLRDVVALGKLPSKFESLEHLDAQNASILAPMIKSEAEAKPNEHRRMMEGFLGKERATLIKAIQTDENVTRLMDSMVARKISDPERSEKFNTIIMLAEGRMMKFHETAATAAEEASKAFTKDYKFTNDKVAIPASKYEQVMAESRDRISFLDSSSIIVPNSVKSMGTSETDYLRAVQTGSSWVSTKNGDGMYLVDHWGNPVITMGPSEDVYDDEAGTKSVLPGKPAPVKIMYDKTYGSLSSRSELSRFDWFTAGASD
jgi:hypothetical protein